MTKNAYVDLSSRAFRTQPRNTHPQARPIAGRFGSFANRDQTPPNASPAAVGCAARVARRSSAPSAAAVHTPPPEATRAHRPRQHRRDSQARRARPRPRRASCTRASDCSPTRRAARAPRTRCCCAVRPRATPSARRARASTTCSAPPRRRAGRRSAQARHRRPQPRRCDAAARYGGGAFAAASACAAPVKQKIERAHRVEKAAFGAAATSRVGRALLPQFVVPETFAVVGALCGLAEKDPLASARLALELVYEMRALVLLDGARRARARGAELRRLLSNCWQLMTSQDTTRVRRISSSIVYVPRGRYDIRNAGSITFPARY